MSLRRVSNRTKTNSFINKSAVSHRQRVPPCATILPTLVYKVIPHFNVLRPLMKLRIFRQFHCAYTVNISLICDKSVITQNLAFLSYWHRKKRSQMQIFFSQPLSDRSWGPLSFLSDWVLRNFTPGLKQVEREPSQYMQCKIIKL